MPDERTLNLYCDQMEEIKKRTEVVTCFINRICNAKYDVPAAECVALQLRKFLELVALASLVANKEEYARQHANFASHWQAKRIIDQIKKVNSDFYPVPTIQNEVRKGYFENKEIERGFLTLDNFKTLYDQCSRLLHARNPFSPKQAADAPRFLQDAPHWMDKIIKLLNHHQIVLAGDKQMIIVLMKSKTNGRSQATLFHEYDPC